MFEPSSIENAVLPGEEVNVDALIVNLLKARPALIELKLVHIVPPSPSVVRIVLGASIVLLSPFANILLTLNMSTSSVVILIYSIILIA